MRRSAFILGLGLLLTGCLDAAHVELPEVDGAALVLLVQGLEEGAPRMVFLRPDDPLPVMRDARLWSLHFDWDPSGLVDFGVPSSPPSGGARQPMPTPLASFSAPRPGQPLLPEELGERLAQLGLPSPDVAGCVANGGCLSDDEPLRCLEACPAPTIEAPHPVEFDCPDGWPAVPGPDGLELCMPAVAERLDCADDAWQGAGADCAPLYPCGAGPWPEAPAGGGPRIYVDPEAAPGGAGTAADPLSSLDELGALESGTRVLVAAGTLRGRLDVTASDVQLIGLCPDRTRWVSAAPSRIQASGVRVAGIGIEADGVAFEVQAGAKLALEGVSVSSPSTAVHVEGATLTVDRLRVRAPLGIDLEASSLTARRVDARGAALVRGVDCEVTLEDIGARGDGDEVATWLDRCPNVRLRRAHFVGFRGGLYLAGPTRRVELQDASFQEIVETGLSLSPVPAPREQPQLYLERLLFDRVGSKAIHLMASAEVVGEHILVFDPGHVGLELRQSPNSPGSATLTNLWVRGPSKNLVRVGTSASEGQPGFSATGEDWVLEGMHLSDDENDAVLLVDNGSSLTLSRAHVGANGRAAVAVLCADATLEDIEVLAASSAFRVTARTQFALRRASIEGARQGNSNPAIVPCEEGPLVYEHVRLQGCLECDAGIVVPPGQRIEATDVELHGFTEGARVGFDGALRLRRADVRDNLTGLVLPVEHDLLDVVRGVRLDNERNVARR